MKPVQSVPNFENLIRAVFPDAETAHEFGVAHNGTNPIQVITLADDLLSPAPETPIYTVAHDGKSGSERSITLGFGTPGSLKARCYLCGTSKLQLRALLFILRQNALRQAQAIEMQQAMAAQANAARVQQPQLIVPERPTLQVVR